MATPGLDKLTYEELLAQRELTQELLRRRYAKEHLLKWNEFVGGEEQPALHHRYLIEKLEQVERGEIPRLIICAPPGSAKSTYTSIRFPAWCMGRHPDWNIIGASHSSDLADDFGASVRNLVDDARFRNVFGFGVSKSSAAKDQWANERGTDRKGIYYAVGVDKSVTGRRADLVIVDDPVKGRQDADSELIRKRVRRWYVSDLLSRRKPGTRIVLVQTRWHEEDLAGTLLPEGWAGETGWLTGRDGERWYVVSFPAIAMEGDQLGRAPGERLWPEYFDEAYFAQTKETYLADRDERGWSALYQQMPSPEEGDQFRREWFRYHAGAPKHRETVKTPERREMRIYGASDYASTNGGGDWTVHGVFGVDPDDNLYVLDWFRARCDTLEWADRFCDMVRRWKPTIWVEERGPIASSVRPFLTKRIQETKAYVVMEGLASISSKPDRAQSIRGRMQQGKVYLPESAPWLEALERELLTFPAGKHDDQVDVFSLIGRFLGGMVRGSSPRPKAAPKFGMEHVTMDMLWRDHKRAQQPHGTLLI